MRSIRHATKKKCIGVTIASAASTDGQLGRRGWTPDLNTVRTTMYTKVECGVAAAVVEKGQVVVEPIASRTDKLTVVGNGILNFDTEAIDLVWTLKPRRGIGISRGSIANPFIKLGGTLASPTLDFKPLQAAVSTGAAVATAGPTLLFRGIYDRVTAENNVCASALTKSRKRIDAKTASTGK